MHSLVWPAGLDRSILRGLPLKIRTRNCLAAAQLMQGDSPLRVRELWGLPAFGRVSLKDLLVHVESFLNECIRLSTTDSKCPGSLNRTPSEPLQDCDVAPTRQEPWESVGKLLGPLLATAAELHGAGTLADVVDPDLMRVASSMGIANDINAIGLDNLVAGTPGLVSRVSSRLDLTLEAASETERTVIDHRLLSASPKTLEEIGLRAGVTRERIRQIHVKLEPRIRAALGVEMQVIASVLKEQLGHMVPESSVERRLDELLRAAPALVNRLFRQALITEMGYRMRNGIYWDKRALKVLAEIRACARRLAEADDVGLVDEERLISELPSEYWRRYWPSLRESCGLYEFCGSVGIRDSAKARAKAALLSIGHPATPQEIARICGFAENKTRSHLSVIPSVVRADKDRWGLKTWVDDEYEGIVGEIVQRIEEDGGATTTERLLRELPSKFNVSPVSVRAYMQAPKFTIRDGRISLASTSLLRLRHLDDVIDGRDGTGAPYWTFRVETRFFDGYSISGVPPEFATALGCRPDENQGVRVANLPHCRDLSLNWNLRSITGASLGYLAGPLQQLGLSPGQRVRVTIRGPGLVDLTADNTSGEQFPASDADTILARMKNRRRAL